MALLLLLLLLLALSYVYLMFIEEAERTGQWGLHEWIVFFMRSPMFYNLS